MTPRTAATLSRRQLSVRLLSPMQPRNTWFRVSSSGEKPYQIQSRSVSDSKLRSGVEKSSNRGHSQIDRERLAKGGRRRRRRSGALWKRTRLSRDSRDLNASVSPPLTQISPLPPSSMISLSFSLYDSNSIQFFTRIFFPF